MSENEIESNVAPSGGGPSASPDPKKRTGKPTFFEDLIVTAFGFATSTAVAWGSWWMASHWDFAVYTWMYAFVIPLGALLCGFVAATGYWVGARLFNHKPSKLLLFNIALVSLSTFFAIHHFHYTNDKMEGVPLEKVMSFGDYLVAVTENMTYKSSRNSGSDSAGTQLGKWGWGISALQIIGFTTGGFIVFGMLGAVPYCDNCAKYLSQKKSKMAQWKAPAAMRQAYENIATLMQEGHLQEAINEHAVLGEKIRLGVQAQLTLELRKCPDCENRRLHLTAKERNGNNWTEVGTYSLHTEDPLVMV
jgi:hypothetical protein